MTYLQDVAGPTACRCFRYLCLAALAACSRDEIKELLSLDSGASSRPIDVRTPVSPRDTRIGAGERLLPSKVASARGTVIFPQVTSFALVLRSTRLHAGMVQSSTAAMWADGRSRLYSTSNYTTGGTIRSDAYHVARSAAGAFLVIALSGCELADTVPTRADISAVPVAAAPPPVATIAVVPGTLSRVAGDSVQLVVVLKDAGGTVLAARVVTWTTSSPGVAGVSSTGMVSALSQGSTTIKAVSEGRSATATVTVTLPALRALAASRGFVIGAAVRDNAFATDAVYRQILAAQYNSLVPENALKFAVVHNTPTQYLFTDADKLVAFAQANAMKIHGHTLVWEGALPAWITGGTFTKAQLLAVMRDHITTVVGRYRGKIASWDVVNEIVSWNGAAGLQTGVWLNTIGPEYIDSAFVWAHRADPAAKLYLNDYAQELFPAKADLIFSVVQGLRSRAIPIDGVGFQAHLTDAPPPASSFRNVVARFANAGFDVRVSEMDQRIANTAGQAALAAQGGAYRDVLDACLRLPRCTSFSTWGFTDRYSFIPVSNPGFGRGLPLDANYRAKPAFNALVARLRAP